jgi:methylthioribose-1-phosphate isomerase
LIKRIVKALNDAVVDYMFTGALATSDYGTPRTTIYIDVIVKLFIEPLKC